jgi:hypothetical protein
LIKFITSPTFFFSSLLNKICWKHTTFITNLACDELIMKIVRSSFIHKFIHFPHKYHVLNTFDTWINVSTDEIWIYEWMNVIQISHLLIICVSNVISMHDISVWNIRIMIEWIFHNFHYLIMRC